MDEEREQHAVSEPPRDRGAWWLTIVAVAGAAVIWIPPIASSFWIDEAGTHWFIKDGLSDALDRGLNYQSGQPLYYTIAWFARAAFGTSEVGMRIPSLIATIAAAWLIYLLGRRLFDKEVGLLAVVGFVSFRAVAFSAIDARPYAFATLFLVAATFYLLKWVDTGGRGPAIGYVLFTSLTIHVHYFYAPALLVHAGYVFILGLRAGHIRTADFFKAWAGIALLLAPLVPSFLKLLDRREGLVTTGDDPATELMVHMLIVPSIFLIGALILRRMNRRSPALAGPERAGVLLAAAWMVVPAASLYLLSAYTSTDVFVPRYLNSAWPGLALLLGWSLRAFEPARVRYAVAALLLVASAFTFGARGHHTDEEWKAAAAAARSMVSGPDTPVLVQSGFIEATDVDWVDDPANREYILAPLIYYPVDARLIPLPYPADFEISEIFDAYLERLSRTVLAGVDRFVVLSNYNDPVVEWFADHFAQEGYAATQERVFGAINVVLFERAT